MSAAPSLPARSSDLQRCRLQASLLSPRRSGSNARGLPDSRGCSTRTDARARRPTMSSTTRSRRGGGTTPPRSHDSKDGVEPSWNGDPRDPLRRGPPSCNFEIRVERDGNRCVLVSLRARHHTDRWAVLSTHGLSASFRHVETSDFAALVLACGAVFGSCPRFSPPRVSERWRLRPCSGCCARCGVLIRGWGLGLYARFERERASGLSDELIGQLDLECAHTLVPNALEDASRDTSLGDPAALGSLLRLESGPLGRCQACQGIVRRDAWRAVRVLVPGTLHLECAAAHEAEGFRAAVLRSTAFPEADAWRARLGAN